jgi:hypothetical protein
VPRSHRKQSTDGVTFKIVIMLPAYNRQEVERRLASRTVTVSRNGYAAPTVATEGVSQPSLGTVRDKLVMTLSAPRDKNCSFSSPPLGENAKRDADCGRPFSTACSRNAAGIQSALHRG